MATMNPFDLLGDNDYEDPSQLVVAGAPKLAEKPNKPYPAQAQPASKPASAAKFPTKPLPPAQAVRESKNEGGRGGGCGGGRGFGRGDGRGFDRDSGNNNTFGSNIGISGGYRPSEEAQEGEAGNPGERHGYGAPRGDRRGGFYKGEPGDGERPYRVFERRSGTGCGNEIKRDGVGRSNWGTPTDEIAPEIEEPVTETENNTSVERPSGDENATDTNKENPVNEQEEKEPEEKMTLDEYEKLLEEKRKALLSLRTAEERKVDVDKEFKSMQALSNKKSNDDIFIKLGSEKDKHEDAADKEDKAKKSVSINEFLKPAEGERHYNPGSRVRGRGRVSRGGYGSGMPSKVAAPSIEDPGQFPSLGGK